MKWCATVFPSVQMTDRVEQLYADVLISLDPSVQYFVDLSLKQHNQPLLLLIQFYELASNFHRDLNVLCHSTNGKNLSDNSILAFNLRVSLLFDFIICCIFYELDLLVAMVCINLNNFNGLEMFLVPLSICEHV